MALTPFQILQQAASGISSPTSIDTTPLKLLPVVSGNVALPSVPSAVSPQTAVTTAGGQNQNVAATVSGVSPLAVATGPSNFLGNIFGDSAASNLIVIVAVLAVGYAFIRFAAKRA